MTSSEQESHRNCALCQPSFQNSQEVLKETENFWAVCDLHPLREGHIFVAPKKHISCIGEYPQELLKEFSVIYEKVKVFIKSQYDEIATFEHGIFGQTIFHSHVHMLPSSGSPEKIIPEGWDKLTPLDNLSGLVKIFSEEGGYLFLSVEDKMWTVDPRLALPGLFRNRFAKAIGVPERGNWKIFHETPTLMETGRKEILSLKEKWNKTKPLS